MNRTKLFVVLIAILLVNSVFFVFNNVKGEDSISQPKLGISYRTHVQDIGWQGYMNNGGMAGTTGKALRLEALNIKLLNNNSDIKLKYQVHIQDIGWQNWMTDGDMAGTTGRSLRLEAIKICLENTEEYSVRYRVHVENIGWQGWMRDGDIAGTTGQSLRLEAIQIEIIKKPKVAMVSIEKPVINSKHYSSSEPTISVSGWRMSTAENAELKLYLDSKEIDSSIISDVTRPDILKSKSEYGTEKQNPLPGFKFDIATSGLSDGKHTLEAKVFDGNDILSQTSTYFYYDTKMHIQYQAHVQDIGWQNWKSDEEEAGTTGKSYRVEALKIKLDNVPKDVHIKYRAYVENIGWQDWKKDGEISGTTGRALRIEAIQIQTEGMDGYNVEYRSHVQDVGWQQWVINEMISGTVEQSLRVEALKMRIVKSENTVVPQIKYSNYTTNGNWYTYLKNGATAGSDTGTVKLEALKIALEKASASASVKYQVHVQNVGWMDYVSNDMQAGVIGQNKAIEAIRIKLEGLPGYTVEYRTYVNGVRWQEWVRDGIVSGTTGENKQIGAIQIKLNIDAYPHNKSDYVNINTSKYPGYKELLDNIQSSHPNWTIKLLYTKLGFNDAVYGEYSRHGANLVPSSSGSGWICSVCGTKPYDTGSWYCASDTAIAYYMDPRNFLNESNIFQFLDANKYESTSVSLSGIQSNVNGTFLAAYANDIDTACKNQGVNPYYVISRLIQENGRAGSSTSRGMNGGDGKTYYNPFNIGAYKTATASVYENALATAKSSGWDTMEKALEGGIVFLKENWLENYQNTLYQNKFDIDSTNGSALYSHQYMQNLSASYSEGLNLRSYYVNANKLDSNLTFIIPVYEGMSSTLSPAPSNTSSTEEYPINVIVNTESSSLALRSGASTSSDVIARYDKGTVLLSVRRGVNSTWQQVVTKDGKVGYMSGEYLKQIEDEKICNYKAHIKTQFSGGLNVRSGPSTKEGFSRIDYLPDYTQITVIDDSTYKGYEENDWVQWSRIILADGRQAFVPSSYVVRD